MATEILSSGDCEDFPPARRQRINRLATGYLAGQPLFIASAQATGSDLRESLRNILKERRIQTPEPDHDQNDAAWADEPSPWTALRQRRRRKASTLEAASARATEAPIRLQIRPQLSTKPSEEALAKAAQLRARNASEQPTKQQPAVAPVTHSAPPTARKVTSFDQRVESRRVYPRTPAEDTLADELRLSRTESPSRRPRATGLPLLGNDSFSTNETVENTPGRVYSLGEVRPGTSERVQSSARDDNRTPSSALRRLAHATGEDDLTRSSRSAEPTSTGELGSTAMDLCTAEQNRPLPRAAWTAINEQTPRPTLTGFAALSTAAEHTTDANLTALHESLMSSAKASVTKRTPNATKGKQRASKGIKVAKASKNSSQGRNSLPGLKDALQVKKAAFVSAPASQSGSTPFVYRKRSKASVGKNSETSEDDEPQRKRSDLGKRTLSRIQGAVVTPESHTLGRDPAVSAAAPVIDVSFNHDSDFTRNLDLALMEQHTNKKLPTSQESTNRSSSVRRALRREMRMSGAEISRAPGEPSSSQPGPSVEGTVSEHDAAAVSSDLITEKRRRTTMQWPGTQMLLNQAQNDLFTSPEKHLERTPHAVHGNDELERTDFIPDTERPPLRQLSQECLPGTQALMEGWSPWSTVKKPRTAKRASFAPSPLVQHDKATPLDHPARLRRNSINARDTLPKTSDRRSSLRFSILTAETPVPPQRKTSIIRPSMTDSQLLADTTIRPGSSAPPIGQTAQSTAGDVDFTSLSFAETNARFAQQEDGSTTEFSSGNQYSSFQAAQVVREDSNPELTLADLATEFLFTADMDAVFR